MEIPLIAGSANAHQRLTVSLGENLIDIQLNYLQNGTWNVNLLQDDVVLASGAMLEPNVDIIRHFELDIGQLIFLGDETTLDNLGANNRLLWVPPDD